MPARQPFTLLCQLARRGPCASRADLHVHTTQSDGSYTPAEMVSLASRAGLAALAITDHDTLAGVASAQAAAVSELEVVPGVEITTEYQGREVHLLGYFVALDHGPLLHALEKLRRHRSERFQEMIERLRQQGVNVPAMEPGRLSATDALGRRHLAELLVQGGQAASYRDAFQRYLGDHNPVVVPKKRLAIEEGLALVRAAGGVAAWAHPSYDCTQDSLAALHTRGLGAVEVEFPSVRRSRSSQLRQWAAELGLAVSGGSDCHGPGRHAPGSCSISSEELARLRPRT